MSEFEWIDYPGTPFDDSIPIRDFILEHIRLEHAALDEMVERMLVSPTRVGIAVVLNEIIDLDNLEAVGMRHYRLDEHVPFGHIYEFPSIVAYEAWQERGHPAR